MILAWCGWQSSVWSFEWKLKRSTLRGKVCYLVHGGSGSYNILCYEYSNKSFLSHKLRCYTGISGSEKSRNNTSEKISYFFTSVDIANQLLTRHSPLAPLGQVDEWTAKPTRFLNTSCLSELSRIMATKTLKTPYRWRTVRFKLL